MRIWESYRPECQRTHRKQTDQRRILEWNSQAACVQMKSDFLRGQFRADEMALGAFRICLSRRKEALQVRSKVPLEWGAVCRFLK